MNPLDLMVGEQVVVIGVGISTVIEVRPTYYLLSSGARLSRTAVIQSLSWLRV